jgi:parvulin-like peptidyl-prolyl isomerase
MIKNIALTSLLVLTLAQAKDYGTVNGEAITESEITMVLSQSGMTYETLDDSMKKRVLDMVVEKKLLTQAALKSGVAKTEAYAKQLEAVKSDIALDVWMKEKMKKLEESLSEDKLKKHYEAHKAQYSVQKKLKARHILVDKEEDAKALVKELDIAKDKQAKFIELAKTKSTGPSGKDGGDLGWFALKRMVPEFSAAADQLKKGGYTKEPVKTQFGYHLIMLDDRKESSVKPFTEVKDQIKEQLSGQAFGKVVKDEVSELKKSAKIELK